jgi:hypothetical protein
VLQLAACSDKVRLPVPAADILASEGLLGRRWEAPVAVAFPIGVGLSRLGVAVLTRSWRLLQLRTADARLGKYVEGMRRDLPAADMPSLVR